MYVLNGLDLFSGIGGISYALREWVRPVAYCEIDLYCQGVLLSRMGKGDIANAPIWDDIKTFPTQGIPKIDICYGGFPCQDISVAGDGKGLEGERSRLFFEIIRLAKEIKPSLLYLENVPAIRSRGGMRVVREITQLGYDCRWCVISAASIGARHKRNRWFLLAHSNCKSSGQTNKEAKSEQTKETTRIRFTRQDWGNLPLDDWISCQCPIPGIPDAIHYELDRAKSLGNSVVPEQCKQAFKILMGLK